MRFALIDNSTLTAVQRLLGQIPIKNKISIDMDILCMESLVEAILFYDRVGFIDDYKPVYRKQRRNLFPQLQPLVPRHISYQAILSQAKTLTEDIVPRVEAGQFTDENFKPFFEMMNMNVIFTWDMSSSVYYLTQKMLAGVGGLDLEKYSRLSSAIYDELIVKNHSRIGRVTDNRATLVDREGQIIKPGTGDYYADKHLSKQVSAFFAGLNWLAFRAIFYTLVASRLEVDLFLHPIRQAFQIEFLSRLHCEDPSLFRPLIDAMNDAASDSLNRILGRTRPFVTMHKIPLFVTWLAQKIDNPQRYIEAAYEIREEKLFGQVREKLAQLESTLASDRAGQFTSEANRLIQEVEKILDTISSKYGASTRQGISLSNLITLWNLSTLATKLPKLPDMDLRIKELEFLKHLVPQVGFKGLYRNVVSDLTQVSRLGKYYEIISSQVVLDKDATEYFAKVEEIGFRNHQSWWKIPM